VTWEVDFHPDCESWAETLGIEDSDALLAAIKVLRDLGPSLGRPLVDSITQTKQSNMKELRPGSTGRTEIRVLFAFDVKRSAILLLGGDKAGQWKDWYRVNIPIAEGRFEAHQRAIRKALKEQEKQQAEDGVRQKKAKGRGRSQ
jgi:hypothetical protein